MGRRPLHVEDAESATRAFPSNVFALAGGAEQLQTTALLILIRLIIEGEIAPSSCLTVIERGHSTLHVHQLQSDPQHHK